MFLTCIPTKDNLVQRGVLSQKGQICTGGCSRNEDIDHLFVTYEFYGNLWSMLSGVLRFSTAAHRNLIDQISLVTQEAFRIKCVWHLTLFIFQWCGLYGMRQIDVYFNIRRNIQNFQAKKLSLILFGGWNQNILFLISTIIFGGIILLFVYLLCLGFYLACSLNFQTIMLSFYHF